MTDTEALKYMKLIYHIMKDYPNYPNKEDLYQAGWVGLAEAEKTYDKSYNTKLSTYAYQSIKGEMSRLVEKDKPIKVSRDLMKLNLKYQKMKILLTQQLMREPSIEEVANYLGVTEEELTEAICASEPVKSIHYSIESDTKDLLFIQSINTSMKSLILPSVEYNQDAILDLKNAIYGLEEKDRKIISYYMTKNQSEIGEIMDMSQVKVSRQLTKIRKEILSKVA